MCVIMNYAELDLISSYRIAHNFILSSVSIVVPALVLFSLIIRVCFMLLILVAVFILADNICNTQ
jgi:hypothetical protein